MLKIIKILTTKSEELDKFLKHVGFGEKDKAEAMLIIKPSLAVELGNLTDCAGRQFKGISGLQYTVWALDLNMWEMIIKYSPMELAKQQLIKLEEQGIKYKEPWRFLFSESKQIDCRNLNKALQEYRNQHTEYVIKLMDHDYDRTIWNHMKSYYWCKQVGEAQALLPAYVINEYYHPPHYFNHFIAYMAQKFSEKKETISFQYGVHGWKQQHDLILGRDYAWLNGSEGWKNYACLRRDEKWDYALLAEDRGYFAEICYDGVDCFANPLWAIDEDSNELTTLFITRTKLRSQLIMQITNGSHGKLNLSSDELFFSYISKDTAVWPPKAQCNKIQPQCAKSSYTSGPQAIPLKLKID